jgi:hypothetical protein
MSTLIGIALLPIVILGRLGAAPMPASEPAGGAPHAVVVELFTSQGCQTCPPADKLLAALGEQSNGRIVPLAFHVDFWNSLGWKDPFSSHDWTTRQQEYARVFRQRDVYTPQAVIDGRSFMNGADANRIRTAIDNAAARPGATISLQTDVADPKLQVRAEVDRPEALRDRKLDVMVALFETGLVTDVSKGENGGHTLQNEYVVRSLRRAGHLTKKDPARTEYATEIKLENGWNRAHLGVAAFLQDPETLEITGAGAKLLTVRSGG